MPSTDQLEDALARGRAGEISLDDVLTVLADAELYLPIDDSTSFRRQQTGDGRWFVPAFSTLEQLRRAEPQVPYLVAAARDLAAGWDSELWMYVNPEGRTPLMLRSDKVGLLPAKPLPGESTVETSSIEVSVRAPRTPPPDELVRAVQAVVSSRDEVAEGYLFEARDDARGERLAAGLVPAAESSVRELQTAVTHLMQLLPADSAVEVMAIDAPLRDVVASSIEPVDNVSAGGF